MLALDERHNDGPDIPEKCDVCFRRDEDVVKCCEHDCSTYVHKHCAKQCEACGDVVCADCTGVYDDEPVCLTCQSSLVRAQHRSDAESELTLEYGTCPFCFAGGWKEIATAYFRTIRYKFGCGTFGQQLDYENSKPKFKMSGECARRVSSKQKPITQEEVTAR